MQKSPPTGIMSLDDFSYEAYNNDFGPLTLNDIILLTRTLNQKRIHTTLHIGTNYKTKARGFCLIACYLMYGK